MNDPNIKTKVVNSESNPAWNVVSQTLGGKYKISRVPYVTIHPNDKRDQALINIETKNRQEALAHAEFISWCFNHSDEIVKLEKNLALPKV